MQNYLKYRFRGVKVMIKAAIPDRSLKLSINESSEYLEG